MAETAAALYGIGMTEAADRIARESTAYHKDILPHLYSGTQQMLLEMPPVCCRPHALMRRFGRVISQGRRMKGRRT